MPKHVLTADQRKSLSDIAKRFRDLSDDLWDLEKTAMTTLADVERKLRSDDERAMMTTAELDMQSCAQAAIDASDSLLALTELTR